MQFDFKEKAKKRQDRNSPIKPFFVYNLKIHPKFHGVNSKFLWGLFSPHGVPPFLTAPTKVWLPGKSTERGWRINGNNRQGASPFCISAHKEPRHSRASCVRGSIALRERGAEFRASLLRLIVRRFVADDIVAGEHHAGVIAALFP